MQILLFLNFCLLALLASSKKYTCVFDELYKDYRPQDHDQGKPDIATTYQLDGRELQISSRTPIRITLDTSDFNTIKAGVNGASDTTTARLDFIKKAMQVAESFYEARLQVTQVTKIFSPATCFDISTPSNDQTNGIASSDLHIYVRYVTDQSIGYGGTGIHCKVFDGTTVPDNTFQAGRPTVGRMIFNTYTLLEDEGITDDQALLTNRRFAAITSTAIHETMHILGFNSALFSTYLDTSLTTGAVYSSTTSGPTSLHASRPDSHLLTTPAVTAWAQSFYNCPGITGMQLENQDSTTPGSHWERVVMYDEIMTGTEIGAQKGFSGLSYAILKDMGWYTVDDTFAETFNYGKDEGCNFYNEACYGSTSYPKYFCDAATQSTISQCSSNFYGKAVCSDQSALMADGCGMWLDYHHCVDPDQSDDGIQSVTAEVYGTDSFCVISTFGTSAISSNSKSRCYQYTCDYTSGSEFIQFTVASYTVNCLKTEAGTNKTISALSGYLECPDFDDFCTDSRKTCQNWCSQNGFCTQGICNCYTGFSGEDCSQTICSTTQFYNPADGTCGTTCPTKTYQNIYSRTCLPCDDACNECLGQPHLCTSCQSTLGNPQYFYNGNCYSECPAGTFLITDTCYDCDTGTANCATCFGTATNCTSCGSSLYLQAPTSGTCQATCQDPTYPLQDTINFKCKSNCDENLVSGGSNTCVLCDPGQFKIVGPSTCSTSCNVGYYPDSTERLCKQCDSSCLYCDGEYAENCTACNPSSTQKYLLLKMCVISCPVGYYANDTAGACELCTTSLNCAACFIDNDGVTLKCSSCKYGYYHRASDNTCVTTCDPLFYKNQWNHSCDSCHGDCGDCTSPYESSCTSCQGVKNFLSNSTGGYCLDTCPTEYYVQTGTNCLSCHATCRTCNGVSSSSCASCIDGLYLYSGYCRYVCPELTYPNPSTYTCDSCNSQCKFCFGSTVDNCTSCVSSLVLNNFTCQASCPTGMIANQWSVCVKFANSLSSLGLLVVGLILTLLW